MINRNEDEIEKAVRLYWRRLDRAGIPEVARMQPSRSASAVEDNAVVLRSGERVLARYRIKAGGKLRSSATA